MTRTGNKPAVKLTKAGKITAEVSRRLRKLYTDEDGNQVDIPWHYMFLDSFREKVAEVAAEVREDLADELADA